MWGKPSTSETKSKWTKEKRDELQLGRNKDYWRWKPILKKAIIKKFREIRDDIASMKVEILAQRNRKM